MSDLAHYTLEPVPKPVEHEPPNVLIVLIILAAVLYTGYTSRDHYLIEDEELGAMPY
tara:strand:+ start:179 stop:349 length:171 start_codon:yes stop_codon:yes gene_type:complete